MAAPILRTGPPPPPGTMARLVRVVRRFFIILVGFTLILFGLALGLVPGIPGWPLGLLGLSLLAGEYVWARRMLKRINEGAVRVRDVFFPRWSKRRRNRAKRKSERNGSTG